MPAISGYGLRILPMIVVVFAVFVNGISSLNCHAGLQFPEGLRTGRIPVAYQAALERS